MDEMKKTFLAVIAFPMVLAACEPTDDMFADDGEGGSGGAPNHNHQTNGVTTATGGPSSTSNASTGSTANATSSSVTTTTGSGNTTSSSTTSGTGGAPDTCVDDNVNASCSTPCDTHCNGELTCYYNVWLLTDNVEDLPVQSCATGTSSSSTGSSMTTSSSSSSSSASSSSSSSSSASSSSSTGSGMTMPTTGVLTIRVRHRNQQVSHAYDMFYANSLESQTPCQVGWNCAAQTKNGNAVEFNVTLEEGTDFVFNGKTDNGAYWCGGTNKTLPITAHWNGQPIWLNVQAWANGCNLKVYTAPVSCPNNDQDCDGKLVNAALQSEKDCDDLDARRFPTQLETLGDNLDLDCDNHNDPAFTYRLGGLPSGIPNVQLVDAGSWNGSAFTGIYNMSWNGSTGSYEATLFLLDPFVEYVERFGNPVQWSPAQSGAPGSGSCYEPLQGITHQVVNAYTNTIVSYSAAQPSHFCHLVKQ